MKRSAANWLPSREQVAAERERRAARAYAEELGGLADPERPAWPPEADGEWQAWIAEHWSSAAIDELETEQRALRIEALDTALGALALAVFEAGHDHAAVRALLASVELSCWPAGSSEEEARLYRREHWGACESIRFERWLAWAPLPGEERREAHAAEWRRQLWGEAMQVRASGPCWWRTMTMPKLEREFERIDVAAGLRLARGRGHDEAYPRPLADAEAEGCP